jgi:hypothetical protein
MCSCVAATAWARPTDWRRNEVMQAASPGEGSGATVQMRGQFKLQAGKWANGRNQAGI